MLWSHATAREIVEAIAGDAATGALAPSEVVALIDQVWQRAALEDGGRG